MDLILLKFGGGFSGSLNGQGYTISNLKISGETQVSIFGGLRGNARISNVIFKNLNVTSTGYQAAGLSTGGAGTGNSNVVIEKVGITGRIQAKGKAYGFIGQTTAYNGTINVTFNDCYAKLDLISDNKYDAAAFSNVEDDTGVATANRCYWSGTNNATGRSSSLIVWSSAYNNNNQSTKSTISVNNCYYDKQKFPLNINTTTSGTGLTTAQMKMQSSYVGWDFENTWYMGPEGYPELKFNN